MSNRDIMNEIGEEYLEEYYDRRRHRTSRRKSIARICFPTVALMIMSAFFVMMVSPVLKNDPIKNIAGVGSSESLMEDNNPAVPDDSFIIREFSIEPPGGGGISASNKFEKSDLPTKGILTSESTLSISYPVYKNKYPMSIYEGYLYEIGDEEITLMTERLNDFLPLIYDASVVDSLEIHTEEYIPHKLIVQNGETRILASVSEISVSIDNYSLSEKEVIDGFENNTYIKAALEYVGIEEPVIVSAVNENIGEAPLCTYLIKDARIANDDRLLQTDSTCVQVRVYHEINSTRISMCDVDISENESVDYPTVPISEVLKYIADKYQDADLNDITIAAYYNSTAIPGYIIPCYRVYFGSTDEEDKLYTGIDILLVDFGEDKYF